MLSLPRCFLPSPRNAVTVGAFIVTLIFLATLANIDHFEGTLENSLPFGLETKIPSHLRPASKTCVSDFDYLRRPEYNLTQSITFQKRCVRAIRDDGVDREVVEHIKEPLLGDSDVLNLDDRCHELQAEKREGLKGRAVMVKSQRSPTNRIPCKPLTLKVPNPYPTRDYSDMIFGVATDYKRLEDSLPQFTHWLANTGARLLAVVLDEGISDRKLDRLKGQFQDRGVESIIVRPWDTKFGPNEQHFTVIRDLLWHSTVDTKWAVIIDDDTFFPSLYSISEAINVNGSDASAYLGGLSENAVAVKFHGHMAYGGAGAFLSMPLVKELEPKIEECLQEIPVRQGDGLLKQCIYNKTETRFTAISGLHQFDMGGDLSGFYESGTMPLSVHHWKSWHRAPVDKISTVSHFCGGCLFQRWKFGSDTVFANGYSIAVYKDGTDDIDLSQTEGTWSGADKSFEWSMGPIRNKTAPGGKKSYRLIDSEKVGENLRQLYVHRAQDDVPKDEDKSKKKQSRSLTEETPDFMDEVVELWWEWPAA